MSNKTKLLLCGIALTVTTGFFTACDQNENIEGGTTASALTEAMAEPVSPKGKPIALFGDLTGDVTTILKEEKFEISSLGSRKITFSDYLSKKENLGTLIFNVSREDLQNIDEIEKIYTDALENYTTVIFESNKLDRKSLIEINNKLLGGTELEGDIVAVMVQKSKEGAYFTTPLGEKYETNLKQSINFTYQDLDTYLKTDYSSTSEYQKQSTSKTSGTTTTYSYTNITLEEAADRACDDSGSNEVRSFELTGWTDGSYFVRNTSNNETYILHRTNTFTAPSTACQGDVSGSMSSASSLTKQWTVTVVAGPKLKTSNEALEVAGGISGSYGRSRTETNSETYNFDLNKTRAQGQFYYTIVDVNDARFKGDVLIRVRCSWRDDLKDRDFIRYVDAKVSYTGTINTSEKFSGKKPITRPAYRSVQWGTALKRC